MKAGEWCFRVLIRLYPRRFRERFEAELLHVYHEDERQNDVRWVRLAFDGISSSLAQHLTEFRRRHAMRTSISHRSSRQSNAGDSMLSVLMQDLRYAIRVLLRQPAFTAVVVCTLALGIGANTAIFSVINGVLIRPLPYPSPERIAHFLHEAPFQTVSEDEFLDYKRELRTFDLLAAFNSGTVSVTSGEAPTRVQNSRVSEDFYPILGARPMLGRLFSADEYRPGAPRVVIMSQTLWKNQFGSDSTLIGRDIQLNGRAFTVVGVLSGDFAYPSSSNGTWTPMRLNPDSTFGRNNHIMTMVGRLAPTVSLSAAKTEARTVGAQLSKMYPETYGRDMLVPRIVSLTESITGNTRPFLVALWGAVGFVLLIACVNVANLFLARGESRRKEVAVRSALGASPGRLSAQFMTESLLYALLGGALGVLLGWMGQRLLIANAPASIPRLDEIHLDGAVLLFTTAIVVTTGLAFGLYPAMRVARGTVGSTLRESGRTSSAASTTRLRRLLVVSEVALAVVMLGGAGIMLRSLWQLQATDLGFNAGNVITAQLSLPAATYDPSRRITFYNEVTTRLAASPGVESAAAMMSLPLVDNGSRWSIMIDNVELRNIGESPSAAPQQVTHDLLRTLQIPIVSGRGFTAQDNERSAPVALVNEALARQLWKGENPLGRTIKMFGNQSTWATIIGVVKDTRDDGLLADVPPTMFFPHAQADRTNYGSALTMNIIARTGGRPEAVVPRLREIVRELDPTVPVARVQTLDQVVSASIANRRFSTSLLSLFATLALLLAGLGIYGVIAYGVSQRTQEIGVRVALGAQRLSVASVVLRESLVMTAIGIILGLTGAVAIAYIARSLLVGVEVFDPATLLVASGLIVATALAAGILPLRRALSVDPATALRME